MTQLLSLPDETLEAILYHTGFLDVSRLRRICKRLLEIIESSTPLKYLIELGISEYDENPRFNGTPAEKLRLLDERNRCWQEMKWRGVDSYILPKLTAQPMFEVWKALGAVLWRVPDRPSFTESDPNLAASQPKHYQFIQHRVRVSDKRLPMRYISLPLAGNLALGAFDPGQDLIVAIGNYGVGMEQTSTINFGRLGSSFEPHPESTVPSVTLPRLTLASSLYVKIAGSLVALISEHILEYQRYLDIFDWKKGIHLTTRQLSSYFAPDVVLVPPDIYVMVPTPLGMAGRIRSLKSETWSTSS